MFANAGAALAAHNWNDRSSGLAPASCSLLSALSLSLVHGHSPAASSGLAFDSCVCCPFVVAALRLVGGAVVLRPALPSFRLVFPAENVCGTRESR